MLRDFSHHSSIKSILFELFLLSTSLKITSRGLQSLKRAKALVTALKKTLCTKKISDRRTTSIHISCLHVHLGLLFQSTSGICLNRKLTIIENKQMYTFKVNTKIKQMVNESNSKNTKIYVKTTKQDLRSRYKKPYNVYHNISTF